jgi:hypothetical protein
VGHFLSSKNWGSTSATPLYSARQYVFITVYLEIEITTHQCEILSFCPTVEKVPKRMNINENYITKISMHKHLRYLNFDNCLIDFFHQKSEQWVRKQGI